MNYRTWLLSVIMLVVIGSPLAAAEPVDWSGWFGGIYGGYISGELNSNDPAHKQSTGDYDDDGFTAGVYATRRSHKENDWVYGLELQLPLHMDKGTAVDKVWFPDKVTYEADYKWAVLAGAQAGKAMGSTLPYVYALAGFANVDGKTYNVDENDQYSPGFVQSAAATHFVWQLGAGIDHVVKETYFAGFRLALFTAAKADHTMSWNEPGPNEFGYDAMLFQVNVGRRF